MPRPADPSIVVGMSSEDARDALRKSLGNAQRIVVKAGTSVVSNENGLPCLPRIGMLVEQISELVNLGKEVIFVSSGAMGLGRNLIERQARAGNQKLVDDLKASRTKYSSAAAATGQLGLMSLYSTLFSTQRVPVAQMLLTELDFRNDETRGNVRNSLQCMLELGIVPVLNENDAVSANKTATGSESFEDNDMLAALVGREMHADLVIFVSDVDGVYTACPTVPGSERIDIFSRSHRPELSLAGRGRGGMAAKIKAALTTLDGSPFNSENCNPPKAALILSGLSLSIREALRGENVGTLFLAVETETAFEGIKSKNAVACRSAMENARLARAGGRALASLSGSARTAILVRLAQMLEESTDEILAVNALDCSDAVAAETSAPLLARLKLTPLKIASLVEGIRVLAKEADPLGVTRVERRLSESLSLKQVNVAIGLIMVIFESRPDCLPQIASLVIRSGNACLLKGGKEASRSNVLLHSIVARALTEASVPKETIGLIESRELVSDLLGSSHIDLVIPRGGNALVESIKNRTRIPVLGHAAGVCHIYVAEDADLGSAIRVVIDSKCSYPSACNAVETILVSSKAVDSLARPINEALLRAGVQVFYGPRASELSFGKETADFGTEYEICVSVLRLWLTCLQQFNTFIDLEVDTPSPSARPIARQGMRLFIWSTLRVFLSTARRAFPTESALDSAQKLGSRRIEFMPEVPLVWKAS